MRFISRVCRFAAPVLFAVVATSAVAAGDISSSSPSVAERLTDARKAIDKGNWRDASYTLSVAVREEPNNADVHNLLGYYNRKKPEPDLAKAFEHYNTALKLNPKHKGAHEYLGEAYLMDKKPLEAEKLLVALEKICGNKTCEEYQDLAAAILKHRTMK
jgi:Flp pilus assembly protein TadD